MKYFQTILLWFITFVAGIAMGFYLHKQSSKQPTPDTSKLTTRIDSIQKLLNDTRKLAKIDSITPKIEIRVDTLKVWLKRKEKPIADSLVYSRFRRSIDRNIARGE